MVLQRLQRDGNDGIVAGMALVNAMWKDLEPRVKLAGVQTSLKEKLLKYHIQIKQYFSICLNAPFSLFKAQMKQRNDGFHYLHNHLQSAMLVYDEVFNMTESHIISINTYS